LAVVIRIEAGAAWRKFLTAGRRQVKSKTRERWTKIAMQNKVQRMKRERLTFKTLFLSALLAFFAFGCASQKPEAQAAPKINPADDYLMYALTTKNMFLNNWKVSPDFTVPSGVLRARAKIAINKDGKVESAKIIDSSGNQEFDESVQQALDRVKFVQSFAADATDEQRTFTINFELTPRTK
jgi:TonB family protein